MGMKIEDDLHFLELARDISARSLDPSTKTGCVLVYEDGSRRPPVLGSGHNRFPHGVADLPERWEVRELKYKIVQHAEVSAVMQAFRRGASLEGATAYVYPWQPCCQCTGLLIEAGVRRVVCPRNEPERWREDMFLSQTLMQEAGVELDHVDLPPE